MKIHWVPRNETRFETTIHRNPIWSSRIYIVNISLNFWRVFFASKKEFNILSVYWFSPAATAFGTDLYRVCACHIFHLNFKFFVGVVVLHEVFVDASTSLKIYKWIGAHTYFSERCKLICKHCNDANHTLIRDEGNNEGTKERKNCWKMNKTNCFVCTRFWMRAPRLSCARSNENSSMRIVQIVGTGALCTPKLRAYLSLFGVAFCSSFGRRDVETTTTTIKKNYVETFILKFVNKWNQNEEKNSFEFRACHSHSARAEHVVFILSHFISCFARACSSFLHVFNICVLHSIFLFHIVSIFLCVSHQLVIISVNTALATALLLCHCCVPLSQNGPLMLCRCVCYITPSGWRKSGEKGWKINQSPATTATTKTDGKKSFLCTLPLLHIYFFHLFARKYVHTFHEY